jgi:hypothetical protein
VVAVALIALLGGCGNQPAPNGSVAQSIPSESSTVDVPSTLGLDPEELTDRYNSQASEDARITDMQVNGTEFSARIDPTLRIYGSLAPNGEIATATIAYTGSTTTDDDPFYDVLTDGMEQLGAVTAFSNFCSAIAIAASEDEANGILTALNYPVGRGTTLVGVDTEASVAGLRFHLHDARLDGILLSVELDQ